MKKIGVLVSGSGTNLQAVIDACASGYIKGKIVTVVSNRKNAYALERAEKNSINSTFISKKDLTVSEYDELLTKHFIEKEVDLIVMAGFMVVVGEKLINKFENRIINIHPSLIPSFCGVGFYGDFVHKAVIEKGVKLTGATVHFVTVGADEGPIIMQKAVDVKFYDTIETLSKRVLEEAEWKILPKAIKYFCEDKIQVVNNKVKIM